MFKCDMLLIAIKKKHNQFSSLPLRPITVINYAKIMFNSHAHPHRLDTQIADSVRKKSKTMKNVVQERKFKSATKRSDNYKAFRRNLTLSWNLKKWTEKKPTTTLCVKRMQLSVLRNTQSQWKTHFSLSQNNDAMLLLCLYTESRIKSPKHILNTLAYS